MKHAIRCSLRLATAALLAVSFAGQTQAQTLGPDFVGDYGITSLLGFPGVPGPHGGITFKAGDPNKLLIIGLSEDPLAAIYEIDVLRDADGHVYSVSGTATLYVATPYATGGLEYEPGGVLLYTTYPTNTLGQIKPGSTVVDKEVNLTPLGVIASTGGVTITPTGFPDSGSLKLTSYDGSTWHDATLVPDGSGTFDVTAVTLEEILPATGPLSITYVDSTYTAFDNQSVLVCEWDAQAVGAYEVDATGDPIQATRREFLTCCTGYTPTGSTIDPVTGDILISDWGSGDQVQVIYPLTPGTNYCTSNPNSTGEAAVFSATGSTSLTQNNLVIYSAPVPNQPSIFFHGSATLQIPFGNSFLCASGGIVRMGVTVGSGNVAMQVVDLPSVGITSAGIRYFQHWFRDPTGGGAFFSTSDGYEIDFMP